VTASWLDRPRVLTSEQNAIHHLCSSPRSVAEIASHLGVHLGIARVLVGDMVALGLASVTSADNDEGPDITTLERLLRDLQQL
jgi:DNA-binding IclR family transcriptional regulator